MTMKKRLTLGAAMLFISVFASGAPAASLQSYFKDVTSLRASFQQTVLDSANVPLQESEGTIAILRPKKFNLEYTKPYHQLYVADGDHIWSYDDDLEQVTVKKQDNLLQNSPALVLSNPEQLEHNYVVTELESKHDLVRFKLVPKGEQGNFESLMLSFKGNRIHVMEIHDNFGQVTFLKFSNVQLNPLLKNELFVFTPPDGVDVINADETL